MSFQAAQLLCLVFVFLVVDFVFSLCVLFPICSLVFVCVYRDFVFVPGLSRFVFGL